MPSYLSWGAQGIVTTQFDKVNNTLADITGLSIYQMEASKRYTFRAVLYTTSLSCAGVQFAIGGTCTATTIRYEGVSYNSAAIAAQTRATALGTAVCATTVTTAVLAYIDGYIQVNAAGTLTCQFAQNVTNAPTASSVLVGSHFKVLGWAS